MQFCYSNKGIHQLLIKVENERPDKDNWYQYIHFNQGAYSNTKTINLDGEFEGVGGIFKISTGKKHIVEIQSSTNSDSGYAWCPADIIKFINELNSTVNNLKTDLNTLNTEIQTLNTRIQELEQSQGN